MKNLLLKTIYGNYQIKELLIKLINSPTIERLKKISQRGASEYYEPYKNFMSRYDHSIGVLALLIRYKQGMPTQIAGLLHDASHTVFSHVGDFLFKHKNQLSSYQDDIQEWFLKKQGINEILKKYNYSLQEILHKSGAHKALEQDLPDICIDRLEYNLRIGLEKEFINLNDIETILNNLNYKNEKWFFTNRNIANIFASISLNMTKSDWANPINILSYLSLAKAMRIALEKNIITKNEIHFSTDDIIWNKLKNSKNKEISFFLKQVENPHKYIKISNQNNYDKKLYAKFRGINPLIRTKNGLERLTEIDYDFAKKYYETKELINNGWYVKFTEHLQ